MSELSINIERAASVNPAKKNARKHSKKQIRQLADSIKVFGFNWPLLVDEANRLIAGHARLEAAKLLGMEEVPTICLSHLDENQKRAFMIADNRLAEAAEWDEELLKLEFTDLLASELEFDLEVTGFEAPELDALLHPVAADEKPREEAEAVGGNAGPAVTAEGDLWQLGAHRLLCGNALEEESYRTLLGDDRPAMVFTDPPYNVPIDGHVSGKGAATHREFAMASGEMSEEEFTSFLQAALGHCVKASPPAALHYICMDWRHGFELQAAARDLYSRLVNLCVWVKSNGGMGSFYRSRHELVFVYQVGAGRHRNNVELGSHGRNRTNVWEYAGVNTFSGTRMADLAAHPTVKPRAMIEDAILDCTAPKAIVLDPFGGSGSTLLAAERTSRAARLMELDPLYVDLTIRRWQELTGGEAVNLSSNKSFAELERQTQGADQ